MFSTAADVARLGEMLRLGGALDGVRVLRESTVAEMCADQLPDDVDPGFQQGLGVRIDDPLNMGALSGPMTVGHTGFTGTSLVVDRAHGRTVVLLSNRVHPSRTWSDVGRIRRSLAQVVVAGQGTRSGASLPRAIDRPRPTPAQRPMDPPGLPVDPPGLLTRIRAELPNLRPAELRVALGILADPAVAAGLSIGTLARQCQTSAATVLRFCRAVGYRSYPALRLELARETGRADGDRPTVPSPTGDISPADSLPEIVAKIAWSDARAIEDTAALLDLDSLAAAIDAGDPATAFDREPEPNGGRIDLGRYGNTSGAGPTEP